MHKAGLSGLLYVGNRECRFHDLKVGGVQLHLEPILLATAAHAIIWS